MRFPHVAPVGLCIGDAALGGFNVLGGFIRCVHVSALATARVSTHSPEKNPPDVPH